MLCWPPNPELHSLSLHDALPISHSAKVAITIVLGESTPASIPPASARYATNSLATTFMPTNDPNCMASAHGTDRKSTRLNYSHVAISYAALCLKNKRKNTRQ